MALNSLTSTLGISLGWNASNTLAGSDYQPIRNNTTINKSLSFGNTVGTAAALQANEVYSAITTLSGLATGGVNLSSLVNVLSTSGVNLASIRVLAIRVLSATDDSAYGNSNAGVVVVGSGGSAFTGFFEGTQKAQCGGVLLFSTGIATGGIAVTGGTRINLHNTSTATAGVQISALGNS